MEDLDDLVASLEDPSHAEEGAIALIETANTLAGQTAICGDISILDTACKRLLATDAPAALLIAGCVLVRLLCRTNENAHRVQLIARPLGAIVAAMRAHMDNAALQVCTCESHAFEFKN